MKFIGNSLQYCAPTTEFDPMWLCPQAWPLTNLASVTGDDEGSHVNRGASSWRNHHSWWWRWPTVGGIRPNVRFEPWRGHEMPHIHKALTFFVR